jgi:hypothetical protein
MSVEPGSGGERDGGEQDLMFCLEPGQGLPTIGGLADGGASPGRGKDHRLLGRVQNAGGAGGGVQVVVEHPADGGVAVGGAVGVAGLLGGVGAQQVMQGVPAGHVLGDQVRAGQLAQQAARASLS